ncbi:MAG: DJ-1/PfpI family protein [Planctomycetes bacterium]|nr:DJ-1/PfpI family protein [Planctomycetota bacterium]
MPTAVVILAEGFEEIEAVTQIDVLRRAGVQVTIAGLAGKVAKGAHQIAISTDLPLSELNFAPDLVVLPGGLPGSENLGNSREVVELLKKQNAAGRWIGAICAAPAYAPVKAGILEGKKATCYPSFESRFGPGTTAVKERVVADQNVVTSMGPGTSLDFALTLVEKLVGADKAKELRAGMLVG